MTISVDPLTYVILIPKTDLTLVQAAPTEIMELDLDTFRGWLNDWEDSPEGMVQTKTHTHNTEVSLGGLTYARVIEILDPYSITFEDGQYAVNLIGANSNVGDKVNVNQVSVRSQNSAGLISSPDIEYASFQSGVWLDGVNGSDDSKGNEQWPVETVGRALVVASYRGFKKIYLLSDTIFGLGHDIDDFVLQGQSHVHTDLTIETAADCKRIKIYNCRVTGVIDGDTEIVDSIVDDITYFNGHIHFCGLIGTILLAGGKKAVLSDCKTIDQDSIPIIDMGGSGQSLAMPNYSGLITIKNLSSADEEIGIGLHAGMVSLEDTITAGTIIIGGTGLLEHTQTGTEEVNKDGLVNIKNIMTAASLAYTDKIYIDPINGTSGTDAPQGTERYPVDTLDSALIIANREQKNILDIVGALTILTGQDVSGFTVFANRSLGNSVVVNSGAITVGTYFENLTVAGTMGGTVRYTTCVMGEIFNFDGGAKNCLLTNDIHITGTGNNYFTECDVYITSSAYVNIYQNAATLNIIRARGRWGIFNKTSVNVTAIDLVAGFIYADSSNNVGEIHVGGIGSVQDDSSAGCTVRQGAINNEYIGQAAAEYDLTGYIEHSTNAGIQVRISYMDTVDIDVLNGATGDTFPMGMPGHAVNNFADAKSILETYQLSKIRINDDIIMPAGANLNGITFISGATIDRTITIPDTATTRGTKFRDILLTGTLDGKVEMDDCQVEDLYNFAGIMSRTSVSGTLSLDDSTGRLSTLDDCRTGGDGSIPILHINGAKLSIVEWSGSLNLETKTGTSVLGISTVAGSFNIKNSCTAGLIIFAGIGTTDVEAGTTSIVYTGGILNKENISNEVLDSVA